jgi:hypothetical protein
MIYALACHFGWKEERRRASTCTLSLNILDSGFSGSESEAGDKSRDSYLLAEEGLKSLTSKDLLALINLRRKRCETFKALVDSPGRFTAGNGINYVCARCGVTSIDNSSWKTLKYRMGAEMERWPAGQTIAGKPFTVEQSKLEEELGLMAWPEADACWEARCPKAECRALNYDRAATLLQIKACLDLLPSEVD